MAEFVRRLLTFLALLLLFVLGVEVLLWSVLFETQDLGWVLKYFVVGLEDLSATGRFALAAFLILSPLFIGALTVRLSRKERILKARSADGDEIQLTEGAVRRCLRHEIKVVPEVAGLATRAANGHTGPRLFLRVLIWAGSDVPAVRRRVKEVAARSLRHLFGIGELDNIQVLVEGLVFRRGNKIKSRRPPGKDKSAKATAKTEADR
jgi:hypothetical protein